MNRVIKQKDWKSIGSENSDVDGGKIVQGLESQALSLMPPGAGIAKRKTN